MRILTSPTNKFIKNAEGAVMESGVFVVKKLHELHKIASLLGLTVTHDGIWMLRSSFIDLPNTETGIFCIPASFPQLIARARTLEAEGKIFDVRVLTQRFEISTHEEPTHLLH